MSRKNYKKSPVEYEAFKRNPQWSKNKKKSNSSKRYSREEEDNKKAL